MKNFANCNPEEFAVQARLFRAPFVEWIKKNGIAEIRKRRPEGFDKLSASERDEALTRIAIENLGEILATAMDNDLEGTKNLICLATFTRPEDFCKHTMVEYLAAIVEMLGSKEVRSFFTFYLAPMLKTFSVG